jgi:exodeoxyribonuclease V alpha subunit
MRKPSARWPPDCWGRWTMSEEAFAQIDLHLAGLIERLSGSRTAGSAAALAGRALSERNICADLAGYAGREIESIGVLPDAASWEKELLASGVVSPGDDIAPLVLDNAGRLYLMRYFLYEQRLAGRILSLASQPICFDACRLREGLARLFPGNADEIDWQKIASIAAATRSFSVITGGPGTGKTTTVARILCLILEQDPSLKIALAAPTGKAAKRLGEAVSNALGALDCEKSIKDAVPSEALTIHRLIGLGSDPSRPAYNEKRPLAADVIVIDEASMVSLPLMSRLVSAMKNGSRLILLGDRDQLSSVEAGFVLGDICDNGTVHEYSREFSLLVKDLTGHELPHGGKSLQDSIVELRKNYRFSSSSGIGLLSTCIKEGLFRAGMPEQDGGVVIRPSPGRAGIRKALAETVIERFSPYIKARDMGEKLDLFNSFRILCALREGPYGVSGMNAAVESILASAGLISPRGEYYDMMPVMITRNDYTLRLFNGDIGIVAKRPDGRLEAWFSQTSGNVQTIRNIPVARLPENEPVFVMTVHKSQGSEFDNVLLILPEKDSEVLTKELIYTGITRTRNTLEIWANPDILETASKRTALRASGLRDALWE